MRSRSGEFVPCFRSSFFRVRCSCFWLLRRHRTTTQSRWTTAPAPLKLAFDAAGEDGPVGVDGHEWAGRQLQDTLLLYERELSERYGQDAAGLHDQQSGMDKPQLCRGCRVHDAGFEFDRARRCAVSGYADDPQHNQHQHDAQGQTMPINFTTDSHFVSSDCGDIPGGQSRPVH